MPACSAPRKVAGRRRLSHRPVAGAGQANTRKVYGRILRRVAAAFGEDIAPDAASAWG